MRLQSDLRWPIAYEFFTICWEGYWLAGIGQVWPRPHDAIRMSYCVLPLAMKLDSAAPAMIEWQAAITLLV